MDKQSTQTLYSPPIRPPNQTPILLIADTKDHPDLPDRAKRSITNQETNPRNALCAENTDVGLLTIPRRNANGQQRT